MYSICISEYTYQCNRIGNSQGCTDEIGALEEKIVKAKKSTFINFFFKAKFKVNKILLYELRLHSR